MLWESPSKCLWLCPFRSQVNDNSLLELSKGVKLWGIFAARGRRVGRHAQIVATFNSIRLQSRKIVKSSVIHYQGTAFMNKTMTYRWSLDLIAFLCEGRSVLDVILAVPYKRTIRCDKICNHASNASTYSATKMLVNTIRCVNRQLWAPTKSQRRTWRWLLFFSEGSFGGTKSGTHQHHYLGQFLRVVAHHWNRHRNDQEISNDIGRSEYGQHVQSIGTLCQEGGNRRPIETPVYTTLKDRCQKECQAPCSHYSNHDPADYVERADMAEDTSPQE